MRVHIYPGGFTTVTPPLHHRYNTPVPEVTESRSTTCFDGVLAAAGVACREACLGNGRNGSGSMGRSRTVAAVGMACLFRSRNDPLPRHPPGAGPVRVSAPSPAPDPRSLGGSVAAAGRGGCGGG